MLVLSRFLNLVPPSYSAQILLAFTPWKIRTKCLEWPPIPRNDKNDEDDENEEDNENDENDEDDEDDENNENDKNDERQKQQERRIRLERQNDGFGEISKKWRIQQYTWLYWQECGC